MSLTAGTRLGPYEIVAALGTGGMGEVFRARDTKLNRDVAIKVLPEVFANDPDRLARFQREAQVLASLNHPNIAHIHGLEESGGVRALVMELVEGEDLSQRIARGTIPFDEALPIAKQITQALEAAHEQGIIHRDLKPANIKLRPDGTVKILDFGLAKALEPVLTSPAAAALANSPTITSPALMTAAGFVLGTAAYMSPEQARGKTVDKRADIWAFGVVLNEMVTGQRLFEGETVSDTLAAVLTREPEWDRVPVKVRRLLRRCLEKDPKRRLRDIGDAMVLLDETDAAPESPPRRSRLVVTLGALAAASTLAAAVLAIAHFREQPPPAQPVQFEIPPPDKTVFGNALSVSPDGRQIAFIAHRQIWVRALDSTQLRLLAGTDGVTNALVWSPDSRFLLFSTTLQVRKIDAFGGPSQTLCDSCPYVRGVAWNREGVILLASAGGITRTTDTGGAPTPLVFANSGVQGSPCFLRDGRHFLYSGRRGIDLGSLDVPASSAFQKQGSQPLLTADAGAFLYALSEDEREGHILFKRDGTLMVQRFDNARLELAGPAVPVAENVGAFGASSTGVLAYRARDGETGSSQLLWYDRDGKQLGQLGPSANYGSLQLSPDGKTVMVDRRESNSIHVWAGDLARGVFSRSNPGGSQDVSSCALPDGRVAFTYSPPGTAGDIYVSAANGTGAPQAWIESENVKHVNQCSDSRFLIYDEHNGAERQDLWILSLNPPASGPRKPIPFLTTSADETFGQFSPDGKWVAYSSDETGRREVYVREFAPDRVPAVGPGKWLISTAGGDKPRWRHDGRELFYLALDRKKMMAVPVKPAPAFEPGSPVPLFDVDDPLGFAPYDVSADGRFLINTPIAASAMTSSPITVILNWTAGLKK